MLLHCMGTQRLCSCCWIAALHQAANAKTASLHYMQVRVGLQELLLRSF
jgi:hypothetical protein